MLQVLVIDDGSPSHKLRKLQQHLPRSVEILPLLKNCGTTAAWCHGLKQSTGDTVVFLNNDTETSAPWVKKLIAPLNGNRIQISGVQPRAEAHMPTSISEQLGSNILLSGWCFAARRDLLNSEVQLDRRFRMYFSDTDLFCQAIHQFGPCLQVVPCSGLTHDGHQTTRDDPKRHRKVKRDRTRFLAKWDAIDSVS